MTDRVFESMRASRLLAALGAAMVTLVGSAALADAPAAIRPTEGARYFNRPGADEAALYADFAKCTDIVNTLPIMIAPVGEGLLNAGIQGIRFSANLENCMIAHKWRVVSVPESDKARVMKLSKTELAQQLNEWVGLDSPPGEIVRSFGRGSMRPAGTGLIMGVFEAQSSLTTRSMDSRRLDALLTNPEKVKPPKIRSAKPLPLRDLKPTSPDHAIFVVRLRPGGSLLSFIRYEADGADAVDDGGINLIAILSPKKDGVRDFAVSVPSGRWRVGVVQGVQTCLSAPSFVSRPNEVLYLGAFDMSDGLKVEMGLEAVDALGLPAAIQSAIKPAHWLNGSRMRCSGVFIDGVALDGIPDQSE